MEVVIKEIEKYATLYRTHLSSIVTIKAKIKSLQEELICY